MPIRCMGRCKRPANTIYGETVLNPVVFGNVKRVIKIDKLIIEDLPVNHTGDKYQQQAYYELTGHNVSVILYRDQGYER